MEINNILYTGFHCTKVLPPMGIDVPGYFSPRYSDGFLTDLHLRATAFECNGQRAVLFSCEAVGIRADAFNVIKKKIAKRCNMDENAVYINCIHSHTSYRITLPDMERRNDDDIFKMRLQQQFVDCAQLTCQQTVMSSRILCLQSTAKFAEINGFIQKIFSSVCCRPRGLYSYLTVWMRSQRKMLPEVSSKR